MRRTVQRVSKGQLITADRFNQLVDAVNLMMTLSGSGGIEVIDGPGGITISSKDGQTEFEGELKGSITRGGSQDVDLEIYSASADDWVKTGITVHMYDRNRMPSGKSLANGDKVSLGLRGSRWILTGFDCLDLT